MSVPPGVTVTLNRNRARSHAHTARSSNNSVSTSLSDEDSSGEGVHVSPSESQDYSDRDYSETEQDYDWIEDKHDLAPSESVSRSSASDHRQLADSSGRHHSRREPSRIRFSHRPPRILRSHHPSSPESVGSHEELYQAYGPDLSRQRPRSYYNWAPQAGGQSHQYAPGYAPQGYNTYTSPNAGAQGQQLVPFGGNASQYSYPPYQQMPPSSQAGYFAPGQHTMHPTMGMPLSSQGGTPYAGTEIIHPPSVPPGYFPYPAPGYHVPHTVAPSPVHYPPMYPSPPAHQTPPPPAQPSAPAPAPATATAPAPATATVSSAEPPKPDPGYEELKKMLLDQKAEQEAREAAAKKAEEEKVALAEAEKKRAEEIAAAAAEAAAKATTEAEKKAADKAADEATKAAEEAAKAKEEADAAMAAAVAAAAPPPPEEKKKPIKFKDAVGRKFSFPFHLCATWEGMEDLIKQAFLHVDIIGPHVAEGHYDLIGPNNEIILPAVWETVIEPDWTITMHMWPMPEPKPEEEPSEGIIDVPPVPPGPAQEDSKKKPAKKKPAKTGMGSWFTGGRPKPKPAKAPKK